MITDLDSGPQRVASDFGATYVPADTRSPSLAPNSRFRVECFKEALLDFVVFEAYGDLVVAERAANMLRSAGARVRIVSE